MGLLRRVTSANQEPPIKERGECDVRVRVRVPLDHVDLFLRGVTRDDIAALLKVLEPDRNHPARAELYNELHQARNLMDRDLYEEIEK